MSEVRKGDYVFIQFGTNDQRTDTNAFMEHSVALGTPDANGIYPTVPGVKSKTPDSIYNFYKDTDYPYAETFILIIQVLSNGILTSILQL